MNINQLNSKKILFSSSLNLFYSSSLKKSANNYYSEKKLRNLIQREPKIGIGRSYIHPSREQKRKDIREKTKKRNAYKELSQKKANKVIDNSLFEKIKKSIANKIAGKYKSPYMEYLYKTKYFFASFMKRHKPTYYNFYQTCYILEKKKCRLYCHYKDFKLIQDNQEYFLKFFEIDESKAYLNYLVYFIYAKDPFVKSKRLICLNKDRKQIRDDYREIIINKVFGAQKIVTSYQLSKESQLIGKSNINNKFIDKKRIKKLSRIIIPKYYLDIKPIFYKINYIYAKDIPSSKIPNIIPNYLANDFRIYSIIKNIILKKKFSILVINDKDYALEERERSHHKKRKSENQKDNKNILSSFISASSKNGTSDTERNKLNLSKMHFMHNEFRRIKEDIDINDVEQLVKKIMNKQQKKGAEEAEETIENLFEKYHKNNNKKDIFLSSLKQPFMGNRTKTTKFRRNTAHMASSGGKSVKSDDRTKGAYANRIKIPKDLEQKLEYLKMRNKELNMKYPLSQYMVKRKKNLNKHNLYLNMDDDEFDFEKFKKMRDNGFIFKAKSENKNVVNKYFPERFLNPKKYKDFLLNNPLLKTMKKIEHYFNSFSTREKKHKNITFDKIDTSEDKKCIRLTKEQLSPNPRIISFKETYKFLIGHNKREDLDDFKNNIIYKTLTFYRQFKTLSEANKNKSNFKKSGAFAFSSFSGSNFDKSVNEWKEAEKEIKNSYNNDSFLSSNLMKKINSENKRRQFTLKNCTTFKECIKCPNVYT